jgi:hypothetical protein
LQALISIYAKLLTERLANEHSELPEAKMGAILATNKDVLDHKSTSKIHIYRVNSSLKEKRQIFLAEEF